MTGTRPVDQSIVSLESLALINSPPVLVVPSGTSVLNSTYRVDVNGQLTVYEWWFYFQNNTAHPSPIAEPVYQYWTVYPWGASMYASYVRFHFASRLGFSGWTLINQTRLVVSFSRTFYIPTVRGGLAGALLSPGQNATVLQNVQPLLDPNAPYPAGSTLSTSVYAPGGGPQDPWVVLNSPETIVNGLTFGSGAALLVGGGSWSLLQIASVEAHPLLRGFQKDLRALGVFRRRDMRRIFAEVFE